MSTVLVLTSSALGDASVSTDIARKAADLLSSQSPGIRIVTRDLGSNPVPHLTLDSATALRGGDPANEAQAVARRLSDDLIAELRDADTIVIGAPMYNFGIPSTLKAWFDHVLRAGVTFRYTENGPVGLVTGKRAIVIESRGGIYSQGPASHLDSQEPHLRAMLGFIGIRDVTFVRAEGLALGPDSRTDGIGSALGQLTRSLRPLELAAA